MAPKIISVMGLNSSGKTTFINQHFNPEKQIIVRIGKFLRESIGLEAMSKDPNPNACMVSEVWVQHHVEGALSTARLMNRDIVFDGFPRTAAQLRRLKHIVEGQDCVRPPAEHIRTMEIHVLETKYPRPDKAEAEKEFDRIRKHHCERDLKEVLDAAVTELIGAWSVKIHHHTTAKDSLS